MAGETDGQRSLSPDELWRYFKFPILLGVVCLICIALSISLFIKSYQSSDPIQFSSSESEQYTESTQSARATITIDVEGAVNNPGVYTLSETSRVEDAIAKAGGLTVGADLQAISQTINRAARLVDGAKIYFPNVGERDADHGDNLLGTVSSLVNINTSSLGELESLSGIGPATAKKIIDNRPYQTLEELVSKKALGQSLFEKLKTQLTL